MSCTCRSGGVCPRRSCCAVTFGTLVLLAALAAPLSAQSPTIETDKPDYLPGETAVITGSGWPDGDVVTLQVVHADGTPDGGDGHEPWTVTATDGTFSTTWYVDPDDSVGSTFLLTAAGASGLTAQVTFTDNIGLNLDQCQNGTLANLGVPCGQSPTKWENGNINGQNSQYREADGIPYRNLIQGIPSGTWVVRLQYDFTKGGVYAIDRLTRFDLTQASNPCLSAAFACGVDVPAFEFAMPGEVPTPTAAAPALPNAGELDIAGSSSGLAPADRLMRVWVSGGTALFVSAGQNAPSFDDNYVLQSGAATGDSSREFAFKVALSGCPTAGNKPGCSLLLGWTGHVASEKDWGSNLGAGSVTGAPFHMRLIGVDQLNGTSGGNQDRSVQLSAILDEGTIVIVKDTVPDDGQDFSFTGSGTLGSFLLDDDNNATLSNTKTFLNVDAGIYTVSEDALPAGWLSTNIVCDDPTGNTTVDPDTRTATIDLEAGETVTCTFTNTSEVIVHPCLIADCNDGNVCTTDSCDESTGVAVCVNTPNTVSCDDGNACTTGDVCSGGECVPGAPLVCDDGNVCTDDSCDPATGCVEVNNTAPCSDGSACTTGDVCSGGECVPGAPLVCDDGNVCTDDSCDPATGCVEENNTAPCSDGSLCTTDDVCAGGECVPGAPLVCDDGNVCTDDSCDPATGCVRANNTDPCDDGVFCNGQDVCAGGECTHDGDPCVGEVCYEGGGICVECLADTDCTGGEVCHPDTNTCEECVGDDDCAEGVCSPGNTCVECLIDTDCTGEEVCDTSTNTCEECVGDDDCAEGVCNPGTNTCQECLNDEHCTDEVCDVGAGVCVECNTSEDCTDPGNPVCNPDTNTCDECLQDEDCQEGVCDPSNNTCVECLDNDDCEEGQFCVEGNLCVECRNDDDCEDNNSCTADSCSEAGECVNTNLECASVTDSSLCPFDVFPNACDGREFRLIFTPDVKVWPGYKLSSSNPGQTYYNLVVENETQVTITVPYPYVTVGARPVHVYCADDMTYDANGCYLPGTAVAAHPLYITMANWLNGTGGCVPAAPPTLGVDDYPANAGTCQMTVPLPEGLCDGRFYVNVHLDYGLKGGSADGTDAGTSPDRYDGANPSPWGTYDAFVNVTSGEPSVVAINDCTPYTFSDDGSGDSDTVFSTNSFKRIAGVFGQITNALTGQPVAGVAGSLTTKSGDVIATSVSDEDGYVMLEYKHLGKAAPFTVWLNIPGVGVLKKDVTLKANGWAEASYDVYTRTWTVVQTGDK